MLGEVAVDQIGEDDLLAVEATEAQTPQLLVEGRCSLAPCPEAGDLMPPAGLVATLPLRCGPPSCARRNRPCEGGSDTSAEPALVESSS